MAEEALRAPQATQPDTIGIDGMNGRQGIHQHVRKAQAGLHARLQRTETAAMQHQALAELDEQERRAGDLHVLAEMEAARRER
ncbi:hypothetical protein D3C78_1756780 [compost metagenome]